MTNFSPAPTEMKPPSYFVIIRRLGFSLKSGAALLALHLASTLFESIGIAMLLPVFQYIQSNSDINALTEKSRPWQLLVQASQWVNIDINLPVLLLASFTAIMLRQIFTFFRLSYMASVQFHFTTMLRNRFFCSILRAGLAQQDSLSSGDMVNLMITELMRGIGAVFAVVVQIGYASLLLFYAIVLVMLSPAMTVVAVAIGVLASLTLRKLFRRTEVIGKEVTLANTSMTMFLVQRLKAMRLIRLCGMEDAEEDAMRTLTEEQRRSLVHLSVLMARIEMVLEPIVIGLGLLFLYSGVTWFSLSLEEMGLFLLIIMRLLPVLKETLRTRQSALGALPALAAVYQQVAALESTPETKGGPLPLDGLRSELELRNVSFSYQAADGHPSATSPRSALQDISVTLKAGTMTALVGPSGGGKSTLVDLLPRLRDPSAGEIIWDGQPLSAYRIADLRAAIAYAPQQPQIFDVTPAQHIRYGHPNASDEDVFRAARLAGADDFIRSLPQGYETRLGEGGSRLSGGQRQRLDLARTLIRRNALIILDEPTSNLDAESELAFQQAIDRIRREESVTILMIGHRLSTVRSADQIVVLDQGRVRELGTHDQLLQSQGWYYNAYSSQSEIAADPVFAPTPSIG